MTNRQLAKRLMSAWLCRTSNFVITLKVPGGIKYYSPDDITLYTEHAHRITLEELQSEPYDTPSMWRIDALTEPSFPTDTASCEELLSAMLPGIDGHVCVCKGMTPTAAIHKLSDGWHGALRDGFRAPKLGLNDQTELRYLIGQTAYEPPSPCRPVNYLVTRLEDMIPSGSFMFRTTISRSCSYIEYPADGVWMTRAIYEMFPTYLYQRLVFGDRHAALNNNNTYMGHTIAIYDPSGVDPMRFYTKQLEILDFVIDHEYDAQSVLALDIRHLDGGLAVNTGRWWRPPRQAAMTGEFINGLNGLPFKMALLCAWKAIVNAENELESINLDCGTSHVKEHLAECHYQDSLYPLINDAWRS